MSKRTVIKTNVIMGEEYQDSVTGFKGIAVAVVKERFNGIKILLQPRIKERSSIIPDTQSFDEQALIGMNGERVEKVIDVDSGTNFPPKPYSF